MEERVIRSLSLEGGESEQAAHPMIDLLEEECWQVVPQRGDIIEGTIVSVSPTEILVDVGCKTEGIVGSRDLEHLDKGIRKSLRVGESILVYVVRPADAQGNMILSLTRAQLEGDWKKAEKLFEAGEIIEEAVTDYNRGGLIINLARVRGFVPASQVVSVSIPRDVSDEDREQLLEQVKGTTLRLKIIELDRKRNRLILSERAAVREWRQGQKERLLDDLQPGDTRRGVISSLCDFGAFVDLGGADGLVHLSELSWRRVGHPKQVLEVGQEVDVYVLSVDKERRRIALSIKKLQKEPWSTVEERYQIGQLVTGQVTKLTNFGAFIQLDQDIEGLVHISEISDQRIGHPRDVLTEGQEITTRIIRIDADRQRIGLSVRRVDEDQYADDWSDTDQLGELDDSTEGGGY